MRKLSALDLFCGAGGLSRGLVEAGFEVLAGVDLNARALESYRMNFPSHATVQASVADLDAARLARVGIHSGIDLVAGGPPCQGFSIQRIGGDADARNDLVMSFARVVSAVRPRAFVLENVPGLLGTRGLRVANSFFSAMELSGYHVRHAILDAADFGVAQGRRRVFIVGFEANRGERFCFPKGDEAHPVTVAQAIGDLASPPEDFSAAPGDPLHRRMRLSALNMRRLAHIPPGGGFEDLPPELRLDCHRLGAAKIGHRAVYGRLHPDRRAGTITARFDSFTRGRFAHFREDRNITLREGARLQGFPDCHVFTGTQEEIASQIGNAVPPPMSAALARNLREALVPSISTTSVDIDQCDPSLLKGLSLIAI